MKLELANSIGIIAGALAQASSSDIDYAIGAASVRLVELKAKYGDNAKPCLAYATASAALLTYKELVERRENKQ